MFDQIIRHVQTHTTMYEAFKDNNKRHYTLHNVVHVNFQVVALRSYQ